MSPKPAPLVECLLLLALLCGSAVSAAGAETPSDRLKLRAPTEAGPAARLIRQLWDAGFFRACPAVRDEICDNVYALLDPRDPLASIQKRGMACFSHGPDGNDTVYLREDIFDHYKVGLEGVLERRSVEAAAFKVLVHELCHDLWANLLDDRDRALFALDGADFIAAYRLAQTPKEKSEFLRRTGQSGRGSDLSLIAADLDTLVASYPPDQSCGPELFAWFGERVFSAGLRIPSPFAPHYAGLLAAAGPGTTDR